MSATILDGKANATNELAQSVAVSDEFVEVSEGA